MYINSTAQLASLLRSAADAHHQYEQEHGKDADWQTWYAEWIAEELAIREARIRAAAKVINNSLR